GFYEEAERLRRELNGLLEFLGGNSSDETDYWPIAEQAFFLALREDGGERPDLEVLWDKRAQGQIIRDVAVDGGLSPDDVRALWDLWRYAKRHPTLSGTWSMG